MRRPSQARRPTIDLRRIPISTLLALAFMVPGALIAALLIGHDAFLARQRLLQEGIRYGLTLGEPILSASQRAWRQGSMGSVQEIVEDLGRSQWVRHLAVIGSDGLVAASNRPDWIGREAGVISEGERGEAATSARATRQPQSRLVDDHRRLVLVWPLHFGDPGPVPPGRDRGFVYVELDLEGRRRELAANVMKRGVLSTLGVLGFGFCLHLVVQVILTRPVRQAAAYARSVANKAAGPRPRIEWPREVADLVRDVGRIGSDLRDKEAALRTAEEQLLRARHKEGITSRAHEMAHDLNNLLTGVLGYARLLLDWVGQGDPIRRQLATIENSATRAADLTARLLTLDLPAGGRTQTDGGETRSAGQDASFPVAIDPPRADTNQAEAAATATILAVDDESTVLALAKDVLEMHGYKVLTARNGEEALRVFRAHGAEIDLVLLDLMMPVMGGRECFRKLRQIDPRVRVLISSGFSTESSASDLLREGAIDYLQKPYDIDYLARAIGAALNKPAPSAAAEAAG